MISKIVMILFSNQIRNFEGDNYCNTVRYFSGVYMHYTISLIVLMTILTNCQSQWHSQYKGKGGRVPPLTAKKLSKIRKREEIR